MQQRKVIISKQCSEIAMLLAFLVKNIWIYNLALCSAVTKSLKGAVSVAEPLSLLNQTVGKYYCAFLSINRTYSSMRIHLTN